MNNYLPLKSRSSSLADKYYRCLAQNLAHSQKAKIAECLKIGREYHAALRAQLEDLERLSNSDFVQHERQLVEQYLKLIERDMDSFAK